MNRASVDLRVATPADAAEIAELFAATCRLAYQDVLPDTWLTRYVPDVQGPRWAGRLAAMPDGHCLTVAERDGRILGFVESHLTPPTGGGDRTVGNVVIDGAGAFAEIDYLFVRPRDMGTGVGRHLLETEERRLAAGGASTAVLWVFRANVAARTFYERSGWAFTGHEQFDAGLGREGHAVVECLYRKALVPDG